MKLKKPLSTGDVARYCRVSAVTVFNWIKANKLKYHTTAGGQYRIERADLVEFMRRFNMPVEQDLLHGDRYRVLACDDDPDILSLIQNIFADDPRVRLDVVNEGYSACVQIGMTLPDLLILDIVMPDFDGVQVCEKIRTIPDTRKMEIIILTGYEDEEKTAALRRLGIRTILHKPIKIDELRAVVYKTLKISSS